MTLNAAWLPRYLDLHDAGAQHVSSVCEWVSDLSLHMTFSIISVGLCDALYAKDVECTVRSTPRGHGKVQ